MHFTPAFRILLTLFTIKKLLAMTKLYLNSRILAITIAMATTFLFAAQSGIHAQTSIKVKTDGQGYVDHQSHLTWDDATSDLQAAIDDLANNGGGEIWVAGGTYQPTLHFSADPTIENQLGADPSNRYLTFVIKETVTVRGGFTGVESDISERPEDLFQENNTTVLSGDIGTPDDPADNSYHVVIFPSGTSDQAVLDGFLITGGNANEGTNFNGRGGGIHARKGGYVINSLISGNTAGTRGGGAYLYKGGKIDNCAIYENQSGIEGGGALINLGGEITHSAIYNNISGSIESNTGEGGGVFLISNGNNNCSINNSIITANIVGNKGGGVAIYEDPENPELFNAKLINTLIANNEAGGNGGGVYTQNSGYLLNNTIVRNKADDGGGVYCNNGGQLINSVLWGNTTTGFLDSDLQFQTTGDVTATANYCAIENGTEGGNISNLISLSPDNTGTTGLHPFFLNPTTFSGFPLNANQEDELRESDYGMELQSPLIDAGNPETPMDELGITDLFGNPRLTKQIIDIGAYETFYHIVTTEVVDETGGTITPDQATKVLNEEEILFTLVPAANHEVISFEINETEHKDDLIDETNGFVYSLQVTEDLEAVVNFGIPDFLPKMSYPNIKVYPNPAEHELFIEGVVVNKIKIYANNGKTIKNFQNLSSGINISDLKKGTYFIEIQDENERRYIKKFIKK